MSLVNSLAAGLLSIGTLMAGILPVMARPATLTTDSNLRTDASLTASVLSVLPPNCDVEVLNITIGSDGNYWYYVRPEIKGKPNGWIRSNLISFKPSNKSYGTLVGSRGAQINVRLSPSLNGKIQHYGLSGDLVTVEDSYRESGNYRWYRVKFPSNAIGWVREDLISVWPKGCIITCPEN
jgi:Bacterial SH3 domain/GW (Gly-Tryp) dipeptide domain